MQPETYALLWSKKSNCFHIEMLMDTVKKGRTFFLTNSTNDYLVIGIGTYEEVSQTADALRPHVNSREDARRSCAMEGL
jgi:hypothetical protein